MLKGIAASRGIVIAKAYKLEENNLEIIKREISNAIKEVEKFNNAKEMSISDLAKIRDNAIKNIGAESGEIFDAHIQIVSDPEFSDAVSNMIETDMVNAEYAVVTVSEMFASMFENMDNEYMKERAADIRDVSRRLQAHTLGVKIADPTLIDEQVIVIADDLTPSDTAQLNKEFVLGFVTNIGGRTSHSAIMARSLEIPAVVGTKSILEDAADGDILILDGINGEVVINPSEEEIKKYDQMKADYEEKLKVYSKLKDAPSISVDGHQVELVANIGSPEDIKGVIDNGGEGVGLYRTEFLYMGRDDFPSEDEQFEAYKAVLEKMRKRPVVIRTLDIGGDKELPYMEMPHEMNPFLGHRAIRLCLDKVDIFKTQLRALLRASVYGNLKIMFPMIATIEEFKKAKTLMLETKIELLEERVEVSNNIEVGIMVEIPATAILADQFAKVVDFFSIGTNDLIQYTFAADRMNQQVSYLYQPYNPSLLRLIKMVIDAAHKENKWAGMCGEMAGEEMAVPILLGLGLDEFSMSATSILPARQLISKLNKKEMESLAERALTMGSNDDVLRLVKEYIEEK